MLPRMQQVPEKRFHPSAFAFILYPGSPSPFLPFFFGGSTSRGRAAGGGVASGFGAVVSVLGLVGSAG